MNPWENEHGWTDTDGFLAAYAKDDNIFWWMDSGHAQNVIDTLIERLEENDAKWARVVEGCELGAYARGVQKCTDILVDMLTGEDGDEMSSDAVEWMEDALAKMGVNRETLYG